MLKETIPKRSRVAVLWNGNDPGSVRNFKETEVAARVLTLQLQSLELRKPNDFDVVFGAASKASPGALITLVNSLIG